MEVDAFNPVFSTYSSIYETAVICAVIILLTYERLWSIQSCPAPFSKEREQFVKGCRRKCCFKSMFYSLTANM